MRPGYLMSSDIWINKEQLAKLLALSQRQTQRAFEKWRSAKPYKGIFASLRPTFGCGGQGGVSYLVALSSLPDDIQARYRDMHGGKPVEPCVVAEPAVTRQTTEVEKPLPPPEWTEDATRKVQTVQKLREARAKGVANITGVVKKIAERGGVNPRTVRKWETLYNQKGAMAFLSKSRADLGTKRYTLSKVWDDRLAEAGVSEERRRKLAERTRHRIRSEYASGSPTSSWSHVQMKVRPWLMARTRDELKAVGGVIPEPEIKKICQVPRTVIEGERATIAVAIHAKDAKRSGDIQKPTIRRDRSGLVPMQYVAGDQHISDTFAKRLDCADATPRAVFWCDLATNRIRGDLFEKEEGKGIRGAHVQDSLARMTSDPNWGLADHYYLDNGPEYGRWIENIDRLSRLKRRIEGRDEGGAAREVTVIRSLPYEPQSKCIEHVFAIHERLMAHYPEHVGSDRTNKKTEHKGRPPKPTDFATLRARLQLAIEIYNDTQQPHSDLLKGQSPNERFASLVEGENGWRSFPLDQRDLKIEFAEEVTRQVKAGGVFSYKGKTYWHLELLALAGIKEKVVLRIPRVLDSDDAYIFDKSGNYIGLAEPEPVFEFGDPAGIEHKKQLTKAFNAKIRGIKNEHDALDQDESLAAVLDTIRTNPQAKPHNVIPYINPEHRKAARDQRRSLAGANGTNDSDYDWSPLDNYWKRNEHSGN